MPEQMEVEIALRDSVSTGLRQIGREIDAVTRRMKEGGDSGDNAFIKFGKGAKETKEALDKTRESMGGLATFMTGMSRTLLGATGIAAGFVAVGTALEGFANKRLELKNLSTDLGFTEEKISIMRRTLARMGFEAGDQEKLIGSLGHALKDVARLGHYSPLLQQLSKMNEGQFGGSLLETVRSGDFNKAMDEIHRRFEQIAEKYGRDSPQAQEFAKTIGWPDSVMQGWKEGTAGVKAAHIASYEMSKQYKDETARLWENVEDLGNKAGGAIVHTLLAIHDAISKVDDAMEKHGFRFYGPIGPLPDIQKLFGPKDTGPAGPKEPAKMGTFGLRDSGDIPSGGIADYVERGMREEDKKTNRLLGEIVDTLKGFEGKTGGSDNRSALSSRSGLTTGIDLSGGASIAPSSGGGSGPSAYQGTPNIGRFANLPRAMSAPGGFLSQSQHAPIQTEQPLPGGSGGRARGGSPDTDSAIVAAARSAGVDPNFMRSIASIESSNNPGSNRGARTQYKGLYQIGRDEWAKYGQGGDIYNAKDNAMAAARLFAHNRDAFTKAMGREPSEGELYVMHQQGLGFFTRGAMTNIKGNPFPGMKGAQTHDSFLEGWSREVAKRKGQYESGGDPGHPVGTRIRQALGGGDAPPSDVLDKAREVAKSGGMPGVMRFMAEQGYPKSGAWCGQFAASVITSTGGRPPKDPAIASNWRNWGESTDNPQPGDIAVRRGAKTGDTGSHVTIVESVDGKTFYGFGGNQGGKAQSSRFSTNRFEFRHQDRQVIDQAVKGKAPGKQKVSVKGEVDFSNMPDASKKSGDELGKFKLLKISPSQQGAKATEGLMTPGDLAHTPYTP